MSPGNDNREAFVIDYDDGFDEEYDLYVHRLDIKKEETRVRKNARMFINKKLSVQMKDKRPLPVIRMRLPIRK